MVKDVTFEQILLVIAVLLLLFQAISTFNKGRKDFKELSGIDRRNKEILDLKEKVSKLESNMAALESRISSSEINLKKISGDTSQIMDVLDGLLLHFISGNDLEKLKETKKNLDHYKNSTR